MANGEHDVVIIGGGAAGVAAARRLHDAGIDCLLVEARSRLGGRAFTVTMAGHPIDLGCGWLHSADQNEWTKIARAQGRTIDETPPPWARSSMGFRLGEHEDYRAAFRAFGKRVSTLATAEKDVPASAALEADGRWNGLISAVIGFISGAEPDQVSARDFDNYEDTEVNWRIVEGFGATIAAHGEGLTIAFDCPVRRIDHSGKRLIIETGKGALKADQAIVTMPTTLVADESLFSPALPNKIDAAKNLPLGLADKLFIALDEPEAFERDSRVFGAKDTSATAAYHLRPFGRAQIEAYFGGKLAWELEAQGDQAFFDFALRQLCAQLGNDFAKRIKPIRIYRWGADPFARGSYSYAEPGKADCRAVLAAPVDDRLFFAGEACSMGSFSTAHGAYRTGIAAAEQVMKMTKK
jgi:monoamine oxidase